MREQELALLEAKLNCEILNQTEKIKGNENILLISFVFVIIDLLFIMRT
jgi:hypothetical protein